MSDLSIFLIAGEASGDALGAALMRGLQAETPTRFDGIGGPLMQAEGLTSRFPMEELSVMGLAEVLPKYRHLKRRIRETAEAVIAAKPDVLVTIDSPDFGLRVAKLVRAARPAQRITHYVAPSIWAWRPGRAKKLVGRVDQVLALLPFEPPLIEAHGIRCDFVGHPVVTQPLPDPAETARFRAAHKGSGPLLTVLPGSRHGEVTRLAPRFGETLARVAQDHPGLTALVPTAPGRTADLQELTADWPVPTTLLPEDAPEAKWLAFTASDAALAASGTVSLELAHAGLPMVIGYDMAPLTRFLLSRMLKIDTVTLVNLVSDTRAVPEFLGTNCRPETMAPALSALLQNGPARQAQEQAAQATMHALGAGGAPPGTRAARAVLDALG